MKHSMRYRFSLLSVVFFGALAAALGLLLVCAGPAATVRAEPVAAVLYVAPDGNDARDCASPANRCLSIQRAVDVAQDGDEIRVAAGSYAGTETVTAGSGYTYTQVVFVARSLTLRGGYTKDDWNASSPETNPTIIDALRQGRGISIVGTGVESVTVDGFIITGGDYTGLGNPASVAWRVCDPTGYDCGGGLFAHQATVVVRNCVITGNVASRVDSGREGQGGGLYLWDLQPGSRIENTTVSSNSIGGSYGNGGGITVQFGEGLVLAQSVVEGNYAPDGGGGIFIFQPRGLVAIETTQFLGNTTQNVNDGGGALAAHVTRDGEALHLDRVRMSDNQARRQGAAIYLVKQGLMSHSRVRMTNLLLDGNRVTSGGSIDAALSIDVGYDLDVTLAHVTAADNQAPSFLRVEAPYGGYSFTAVLTNTLLKSSSGAFVGRQQAGAGALLIRHTNTLTDGVPTLHYTEAGFPTFQAVNPLGGDSRLDPDYRLGYGSAAIDAGVDAGVMVDIDGTPRPIRSLPDIGADEAGYWTFLPLALSE